jgi:stage III sporulation protein AE
MNRKYRVWMIRIFIVLAVMAFQNMFVYEVSAENDSIENIIIDEQSHLDEITAIEKQLKELYNMDAKKLFPEYKPDGIVNDAAKGKLSFDIYGLLKRALAYLLQEVYLNIAILAKLTGLIIICAILKNLQSSFLSDSVGELAFYACYAVIVSILLISFNIALEMARNVIDMMVCFMQASIPLLITLLASGGGIISGGLFHPVLIFIVQISGIVMKNFFIPLIFLSSVISIINNITDKVQISKLASFLRQICVWSIGIIMTIFVGIITIQAPLGAVVDGVGGKTIKYALGAFIPIVGKYLGEATDTVLGCTLLIKNAAGIGILIGILVVCAVPLLKMFAILILYRLACVLSEPVAEKRITNCINDMANSLTYIIGIVCIVSLMFVLAVTAIISAGNIGAMVR